ncbi:MAG: hypothetical protein M1839_001443 [Geoglossum umbratile]|nr:MAG: hypothetical protein M1839_001443 [Geoglossum umbratile]
MALVLIESGGRAVRSWVSKLGLQEPKFTDRKLWSILSLSVDKEAVLRLDMDISGDYKFLPDYGTASGCLHKRVPLQTDGEDATALFLFLDPSRYGNPLHAYFVFSADIRRYNYGEQRPIVAWLDPCTTDVQWADTKSTEFKTVAFDARTTYATPHPDMDIEFTNDSCTIANAILSCKIPFPEGDEVGWTKGVWIEVDKLNEKTIFLSFAWLTVRKFLASSVGAKQKCAPSLPNVKWRRVENGKLEPFEDPQGMGLLRIGLNVSSLIHPAFSNLLQKGSLLNVELFWRLTTDYVPPPKAVLPKLSLRSNKRDPSCSQPPHFKMALRPEQLRSLSWMRHQEAKGGAPFREEQIEETFPPHLGWSAEGRATKDITIRDDSQFPAKRIPLEDVPGKIPLKATLITAPHTLLKQWCNELSGHKIFDFQNADIIIINWFVLNNKNFFLKLAHFAALLEMPSGTGCTFKAWYNYALQHVVEHVDTFREDGTYILRETLGAKLRSFKDDEELVRYVPFKWLHGKAYQKAQQAKANGEPRGGEEKAEVVSLSDSKIPIKKAPSDSFSLRENSILKN